MWFCNFKVDISFGENKIGIAKHILYFITFIVHLHTTHKNWYVRLHRVVVWLTIFSEFSPLVAPPLGRCCVPETAKVSYSWTSPGSRFWVRGRLQNLHDLSLLNLGFLVTPVINIWFSLLLRFWYYFSQLIQLFVWRSRISFELTKRLEEN